MYKKLLLVLICFSLNNSAELIMKVTLNSSISEEKVSSLSKIIFSETSMISSSTYDLDVIKKIEFYEDNSTNISNSDFKISSHKKKSDIDFMINRDKLTLNLSSSSKLSVSLYSINGKKVKELFKGNATVGNLELKLNKTTIANGFYTIVVKSNNELYMRKIVLN